MEMIIIKHIAGSKSNQTETFELPIQEIVFGRENNCQVVFDPEKDDLVGRLHCKITIQNENQFLLTDLNSRNKTFVNNVEVTSPQQLQAGDIIQLGKGKGGVQFTFDLDPKPHKPKATRLGDTFSSVAPTRVEPTFFDEPNQNQTNSTASDSVKPAGIGANTAMGMIYKANTETRKKMINYGVGIIGIIAIISGAFVYTTYQGKVEFKKAVDDSAKLHEEEYAQQIKKIETLQQEQGMTSTNIFKNYGNSTVLIETSWKLIHIPTGKQVFHKVDCIAQNGKCITKKMPWYIFINGSVEPFLDLENGNPIGSSSSGSGFVVKEDGYILTNRHVAASWHTQDSNFPLPGVLFVCNDADCTAPQISELGNDPTSRYVASLNSWVPSKTKMFGKKPLHGKIVEGRNDYLEVTFPKTGLRIPAHLVRVSDSADVALIKVDLPEPLKPVQMSSEDKAESGETITVMGYPGISPDVAVKVKSEDRFNREGNWQQIPDPTVTNGNIGKVISGSATTLSESVNDYFSEMGDVYQLTVNATGSGNSGGPVFNNKGHVIGIFTSKSNDQSGTSISFAVPIKHGQEIMGVHKIIQ